MGGEERQGENVFCFSHLVSRHSNQLFESRISLLSSTFIHSTLEHHLPAELTAQILEWLR